MAAHTLLITSAHNKGRIELHGDMDVSLNTIMDETFSVSFFTVTTETFQINSTLSIIDKTGTRVNTFNFGGTAGAFFELMYNAIRSAWVIVSHNMIAVTNSSNKVLIPHYVWEVYPVIGTISSSKCIGFDKYNIVANGNGLTHDVLVESNSAYCGYVPPDITPPIISMVTSSTSVLAAGNVTLTATATDNIAVSKVEFYRNGTLAGTVLVSPYTFTVALGYSDNGTINFISKAYDAAGNLAATAPISILVNCPKPPDVTAPVITLSSTSTSVITAGSITLTAPATDNVGVTKVEFYSGSALIGTVTASPYVLNQSFVSSSNGSYSYTAKAYDAAGNFTITAATVVTVNIPTTAPNAPGGIVPFSMDAATHNEYSAAISSATVGVKRMAAANAVIAAMQPSYRLNIYQDATLVIPIEYSGALTVTDDGVNVLINLGTPTSNNPLITASLTQGVWHFELQGGSTHSRTLIGSVGVTGSSANLILDNNPTPGICVNISPQFVIPRSVDSLV